MNEDSNGGEATPLRSTPIRRRPEDTSDGCRARGDADLERARETSEARMRIRMEVSASSWFRRADMLGRLEQSFLRRGAGSLGSATSVGAR